jgi:serine/threonine protein kinase
LGGGRYLVTAELGRGESSAVYLAYDLKSDAWRALKLLAIDYRQDSAMRQRFEREARALLEFDHENIIKVYDVHLDAFQPFISMELATGGSLMEWIKDKGPMPALLAVDVAVQICDGVTAAHEMGIVHRDIKPHNVLVNEAGQVKVTDFGVASMGDDDDVAAMLTQAGAALGTFAFMPPEQRKDPKSVGVQADVYATAATFYTLLTGNTATELFMADFDSELLVDVHEALQQVILRGAAYKPADRYDSMQELRADLLKATSDITDAIADLPSLLRGFPMELPSRPPERLADGVRLAEIERGLALEGRERASTTHAPARGHDPGYLLPDESPTNPGGVGFVARVFSVPSLIQELSTPSRPVERTDPTPKAPPQRTATPRPPSVPPPAAPAPPPAEPVPEPETDAESSDVGVRILAGLTTIFVMFGVFLMMFVFSFYTARHQILVSQASCQGAERALAKAIHDEQFLVEQLQPGRARIALRELYFEHNDAADGAKLGFGLGFVNVVETQYSLLTRKPRDLEESVKKLQATRHDALVARQSWRSVSTGVRPSIILGLGLAQAPVSGTSAPGLK